MSESSIVSRAHAIKTQIDAAAFLRDSGYKCSKSLFNKDYKSGKIPTNSDGHFEESALLGYAAVHLEATGKLDSRLLANASADRVAADTRLKEIQADRFNLKLQKEKGLLMPRSDHERELAARALFFKKEVENFIFLYGPEMLHMLGVSEIRQKELTAFWLDKTADWMDIWSQDRSFTVGGDDEQLVVEPSYAQPESGTQEEDEAGVYYE